jgi:hypothetical protein
VKRSQFEWWEEAIIALGIWLAMVTGGVCKAAHTARSRQKTRP